MAGSKAARPSAQKPSVINNSMIKRKPRRRTAVARRVSDSSFNVAALTSSMVSTPKVGSKRWKKQLTAAVRQRGGPRASARKGSKRKSTAEDGGITPPPAKKPRLPAGNSLQKMTASMGDLFRNDHVAWSLDPLPSGPQNAPPLSESVIEIVDSDNEDAEREEGEIVSTLVETGQELLDLVTPSDGQQQIPPPTPRTILNRIAAPPLPRESNQTITLDDTADEESRTSSPCSVIEIVNPAADDVVEIPSSRRRLEPPTTSANIQSIAAKYYTPPSLDYIPLSVRLSGTLRRVRPTWAEVAASPPAAATHPRNRAARASRAGRAECRGRGGAGAGARFAAPMDRPNLKFGGPAPMPGELFRFTGRAAADSAASATIYSVGTSEGRRSGGLRPIVIDGSNVAMSHGRQTTFSVQGIRLIVDFFRERGHHKIVAFLPEFRKKASMSSDPKLLDTMEREGYVVCTPSRETDTARIASYDDKFILDYAAKNGGVVITRDNYRDLIREKAEWREVIEQRLLMPTFPDQDSVMFPDDPLGRHGPGLSEFLRF